MKRNGRPKGDNKVVRNFRIDPRLNERLKKESKAQRRTETAIVEIALENLFGIGQSVAA